MARRKSTIPQKDFSLGEVRPDAIERDDTDLVSRSLQQAENTTITSTGAVENRPGSFYLATVGGDDGIEIAPADGVRFVLVVVPSGVEIYTEQGKLSVSFSGAPWATGENVWINDIGDVILIGSSVSTPFALEYSKGIFSFAAMAFFGGVGDSVAQPYWPYEPGVKITPSALTGSITVTADTPVFSANYVGQRIRYVEKEILVDSLVSSTLINGTVKQELHPTKKITVDDSTGFLVDEAVEHDILGGQGLITAISGNDIDVLVTKFLTGFDAAGNPNLVGPNAKSEITAVVAATPAGTKLWDEPLMSPERGYPGSSENHAGRVIFCDFPQAPNVVAISAAGTINDFTVGTNDDDAILDTIGVSKSTRVLHAVSAEDLLLLTSKGAYYQKTRDRTPLTPQNWDPVKFDDTGASRIRPVRVFDGVVFVGASRQNIIGAILQGDINKAWILVPLSDFHSHLISSPIRLGSTNNDSDRPERFVFIINDDFSAAVMRWERGPAFDGDSVGFVPWTTAGDYKSIFMAFGKTHAIVERTINSSVVRFLERLDATAFVDAGSGFSTSALICVVDENGDQLVDESGDHVCGKPPPAIHLAGHTASVYLDDYDLGDRVIDADGIPLDENGDPLVLPSSTNEAQIGLSFPTRITPWSRRSVEGINKRRESQRIIRLSVAVQDTLRFSVNGEDWGGYRIGDDLSVPPQRRTEHAHFYPMVREPYQDIPLVRDRPGPFRVTAMYFKVGL